MKKMMLWLLALMVFQATYAQKKSIDLNEAEFVSKVHDFHKNAEFKYLGDKPAIIDFYADWCGPCKVISPYLEKIATQYEGKLYVYKVNVDNNREISKAFGVTSIPMVLFVPIGADPRKSVGSMPEASYFDAVKNVLNVQ